MVSGGDLTANQTAERLNITVNHLRQLQHRKQLVWKVKRGKMVYYSELDVIAYADARNPKRQIRQETHGNY